MENLPNNNIMPVPPSSPHKADLFSIFTQVMLAFVFIQILLFIVIITFAPSGLGNVSNSVDDLVHVVLVIAALYLVYCTIVFNEFRKNIFIGLNISLFILIIGFLLLYLNVNNFSLGYLLLPVIAIVLLALQKEKFVN